MLSVPELLQMYKEEKAAIVDPIFGGEFPTFPEWKAEYVKEYNENHVTVTVKEADRHFDDLVDALEDAEAEVDGEAKTKPAVATKRKRGRPKNSERVVKVKKVKKIDHAHAIFTEMAGAKRKDVVARFVAEVGLTANGASTYYQKFRSGSK